MNKLNLALEPNSLPGVENFISFLPGGIVMS